jgi:hypothetical protein
MFFFSSSIDFFNLFQAFVCISPFFPFVFLFSSSSVEPPLLSSLAPIPEEECGRFLNTNQLIPSPWTIIFSKHGTFFATLHAGMETMTNVKNNKNITNFIPRFFNISKAVKKVPLNLITLGPVITDNINQMIVLIVFPSTER